MKLEAINLIETHSDLCFHIFILDKFFVEEKRIPIKTNNDIVNEKKKI